LESEESDDLVVGVDVQAYDATLTGIASLGTAADKMLYTTAADTWAETSVTSAGRAILDDTNSAAQRVTLGLQIGSDVQAYDATLTSLTSLGTAADKMLYTTAIDTWAETSVTSAGRAILDDANSAAQRVTLGLQIGTDVQAQSVNLQDVSDLTLVKGQVLVSDGSDLLALSVGTNGQTLIADSSDSEGVVWGRNRTWTHHMDWPEGTAQANNTINYFGWAPFGCRLDKLTVVMVSLNTQGTFTLSLNNQATVASMLSGSSYNMNGLSAATVTSIPLSGTDANLALAENGGWQLSLVSNDANFDGSGIYIQLHFEEI